MKKLLACLGILLFGLVSLSAQTFDFKLTNRTGYTVTQIFVSPTGVEEWGDDVLGIGLLEQGKTAHITFDPAYELILLAFEVDQYDLLVVDEAGDRHLWTGLRLAAINSLEISLDRNGRGVAKIK